MYELFATMKGWQWKTNYESKNELGGYKEASFEIKGRDIYSFLRYETGVHRVQRIPATEKNGRVHTSTASVAVLPIRKKVLFEINAADLEMEYSRSGGKGGQNVNKVETAVRIKHLPTGLAVRCAQERSQAMNKAIAIKRLKGQLLAIAKEQNISDLKAIQGDVVEAAWGAQIRNYVLHPYKMVKDARTGWETSDTGSFLDGDLEDCIGTLLRKRAKEEQDDAEEKAKQH
jgi:peptide chain release factor 2